MAAGEASDGLPIRDPDLHCESSNALHPRSAARRTGPGRTCRMHLVQTDAVAIDVVEKYRPQTETSAFLFDVMGGNAGAQSLPSFIYKRWLLQRVTYICDDFQLRNSAVRDIYRRRKFPKPADYKTAYT
ncbi:unnamed protein product [Ixodes hexagonus]